MGDVQVKPGVRTTEFWVAAITQLAGLFTLFGGVDVTSQAQGAVQAVGGAIIAVSALGYTISRGLTKKGALEGVVPTNKEI